MVKWLMAFLVGLSLFLAPTTLAKGPNFITVINPVRGSDFWELKDQEPSLVVSREIEVLKNYQVPTTWLVRFDALNNQSIVSALQNSSDEKGLFLEITPTWTTQAGVTYRKSAVWHNAGSVFLTGYTQDERKKLIDSAFEKFKLVFGYYPKSVGAWWVDGYSLDYMRQKYNIVSNLIVSDQYSTDNYQIWGQYFSTPYLPAKRNALIPAQSTDQKIGVLNLQWAPRDPVNSYGKGVEESTYSTQPNDYIDYHNLNSDYFKKLVDTYFNQQFNRFNQLVVGLENSYSWSKYGPEYQKQIQILSQERSQGNLLFMTMSGFTNWYNSNFDISPPQLIVSDDPLGSNQKSLWYMDPYYRLGWFYNQEGSEIRDIKNYVAGSTEICFNEPCQSLNFATVAIRSLDDAFFQQRYLLDQGKISNFQVNFDGQDVNFSYNNEAGSKRQIGLLPRDISIDGVVTSIDTTILKAQTLPLITKQYQFQEDAAQASQFKESYRELVFNILKFIGFILLITLPLFSVIRNIAGINKIFLSLVVSLVVFTLISIPLGYLKLYPLMYGLIILADLACLLKRPRLEISRFSRVDIVTLLIIISGIIFQVIPTFKSGWIYDFGVGFWGPNAHDGVWHLTLINQLMKGLPPDNPILAGVNLKNYHFLYDLLLAQVANLTKIPVADLLFRFFPVVLSGLGGIGVYLLTLKLFKSKVAANLALYLNFFCGSFGWVVDYIQHRTFNGESAFWAQQSISLNLNPPFAISLIILSAIFLLILEKTKLNLILVGVLAGSLFGFKSYAGILILGSLGLYSIYGFIKFKETKLILTLIGASILTLVIFIPNFSPNNVFIFDPFWLVHSIIDFPDRVGWARLSSARTAYFERGQWLKFILVEIIGLIIFVGGNLGVRIVGLAIKQKFDKKLLFLIFSFLSLIIPLLFIQKGTPWNIVQFFYYLMFMSIIFSGWVLFNLSKTKFGFILTLGLLIIAPINSLVVAKGYLISQPHTYISLNEYEALNFLAKQPQGVVLTIPFDSRIKDKLNDPRPLFIYDSTAYVGAISKKSVFVEDEEQNDILQTDYKNRLVSSTDFFRAGSPDFLKKNNIKYIYLLKYFNINLDTQRLGLNKIFENSEVVIYD